MTYFKSLTAARANYQGLPQLESRKRLFWCHGYGFVTLALRRVCPCGRRITSDVEVVVSEAQAAVLLHFNSLGDSKSSYFGKIGFALKEMSDCIGLGISRTESLVVCFVA